MSQLQITKIVFLVLPEQKTDMKKVNPFLCGSMMRKQRSLLCLRGTFESVLRNIELQF